MRNNPIHIPTVKKIFENFYPNACGFKKKLYLCNAFEKNKCSGIGSLDEWLSQRSAKPCTAVRIRQEPPESLNALLAQLVEQLTLNQWVQGSNP